MALRSGFKLAAAVGRGRVARAAVMPWRVAGVARVVPAVRAFATQFGDAEGAVEDDHPVDDCTRAGKFKEMFAELQNIEHVQLVDCSPMALYNRAHMLGAIPLGEHQRRMKSATAGLHVTTRSEMEALMKEMKIGPDTYVFAYDSENGVYASRFVWTMWYYGHANAYVPSGGWNEWLRQHQPIGFGSGSLEAHAKEEAPSQRWIPNVQETLIATANDIEDPLVQLVDCRTEAEFVGSDLRGNKRGGHIPGARHLDWRQFCDRSNPEYLKTPEEREALLASVGGFDRDRPVVAYCQAGIRSSFVAIALADLGYQVANYDASMAEWLNDETREVEEGPMKF